MVYDFRKKSINLNVRNLGVSATLGINELSNELMATGRKVYKMGLGQSPYPVPHSVAAELAKHVYEKDYLPVKGLYALRESVANNHNRKQGLHDSAEDVLIGPGSKELMFILQLVYYGDLVIPTPSWVSYAPQAHIIGRNVRWLNTTRANNWCLTAEELETYCAKDPDCPRIVILNYPSNPTGQTYSDDQLKEIAEVARKYHIVLLSDEIYGELHHHGKHRSISHYYPEGTIVSSGLSKWCGAGGWRLGTNIFPKGLRWLLDAMAVVASETFTSTSAPIQYAAIRAFDGGDDIEEYLDHSRKVLLYLGQSIYKKLHDAGVCNPEPEGGFYLMPDFSPLRDKLREKGILNSTDLCDRLLQDTGVAILPGRAFGRPDEELTARLAYVNFDGEQALNACAEVPAGEPLDDEWLKKNCGDVVEAIDAMCDWVHDIEG